MSSGGPLASKGTPSGRGVTVSTKGMISSPDGVTAPTVGHEGDPLVLSISRLPVRIVIPTAANSVLMVVENILENLRGLQSSNIAVSSMYKRAFLIAYETDEIAIVKS